MDIKCEFQEIVNEFFENISLKEGSILVLGCSTSEVCGARIGKGSAYEVGEQIIDILISETKKRGIYLAVGCCEHLNRAVVIEREAQEKFGFEEVCVVPQIHAGGSAGTAAFKKFDNPVMIETVNADAGIDIGDSFIGMHLKRVSVPVRLSKNTLGSAHVTYSKTRPKLIGGERAIYK